MTDAPTTLFVGVDVSKDSLDICLLQAQPPHQQQHFALPNSPDGIRRLVDKLMPLGVQLLVVESTGGYERRTAIELMTAGVPVAVVNPTRVRRFAEAFGTLAKTDRIDSRILAEFARRLEPRPSEKPSEQQLLLDELLTRRRQLVAMKTMETNRQRQAVSRLMTQQLAAHLRHLDKQIEQVDRELDSLIDHDQDFQERLRIVDSVPGIGRLSAFKLLIDLPELGNLNRGQIASLAGVAPMNRDSGTQRGKRMIRGGRVAPRNALFMIAWVAKRRNAKIHAYAQRLLAAGKPFKVVMVACMRKILTILNVMVKTRTSWNDNLVGA
jgi:transposase